MLRALRKFWPIPIVLAAGFYFLVIAPWMSGARIRVPATMDSRLFGVWTGPWVEHPGQRRERMITVLSSDGTGSWKKRIGEAAPFEWGTQGGVLYAKYRGSDNWMGPHIPYSLSTDGEVLSFNEAQNTEILRPQMHRFHFPVRRALTWRNLN